VQHDVFQVSSGKKRVSQRFVQVSHAQNAKNGFSLPLWAFLINLHVPQVPKGKKETSVPYICMKHSKKFPSSFKYHLT
jgi:hypothetical protein